MADPEQMEGKECDARSDIYALGLVLYEMAAGRRLPRGQPPSMEGLPPQLAHVIERCLESEPENRWQSASDVKRELEWAGKTQLARGPVPADARQQARTRPLPWLVAALAAVVALALGVLLWRTTRPVDRPLMRFSADLRPEAVEAGWPVAWMDSTGKTQPLLAAPGQYYFPRFSPDGKRLALAVGPFAVGDIQVYDWQRDTMTRLTFTQGNLFPVWTPDGKHIVFQSKSPAASSIRLIRSDGAGEAQLLLESKGELRPYSFSPDGKRLAFSELGVDTGFDLWTLPLDVSDPEHPKPGKPELFLRTPFGEYEPAFSPDGRWIAYASSESGRPEVYVRPFPGGASSGSGKWQISTGGGLHPIWSRDGRELFYQSVDNRIMVSTYTAKADSFAANKPRLWSNTQIPDPGPGIQWSLDLAPDGKRFAVFPRPDATGEQKGSVHVTVLLNFFDELRRRVPAGSKN